MDVTFRFRTGAHHVIPLKTEAIITKEFFGLDDTLVLRAPDDVQTMQAIYMTAMSDTLCIRSRDRACITSIALGVRNVIDNLCLRASDGTPANVSIRLVENGSGDTTLTIQTSDRIALRTAVLHLLSEIAKRRIGELDPYPVPDTVTQTNL